MTEVLGFLEKPWWKSYSRVPASVIKKKKKVCPSGPSSEFLLQRSLGVSPGWFPDSLVKLTPHLVIHPFILKLATEQYTQLQGSLRIFLGKRSSWGEKQRCDKLNPARKPLSSKPRLLSESH